MSFFCHRDASWLIGAQVNEEEESSYEEGNDRSGPLGMPDMRDPWPDRSAQKPMEEEEEEELFSHGPNSVEAGVTSGAAAGGKPVVGCM